MNDESEYYEQYSMRKYQRGHECDGCKRACSPRVNQDATSSFKVAFSLTSKGDRLRRPETAWYNTRLNINFANRVALFKIFQFLFLKKIILILLTTILLYFIDQLLPHWLYFILFYSILSIVKYFIDKNIKKYLNMGKKLIN